MRPAFEPSRIIPPSPEPESIPDAEAVSAPRASGVNKDKGVSIPPSKKAPVMRPKGIVIGTPAASTLAPEEEEMPEDISHALPATDVPLASLNEKEHLAFALRASIDTVWEEQAVRLASFIFDRSAAGLLPGEAIEATAATERIAEATSRTGGEPEATPTTSHSNNEPCRCSDGVGTRAYSFTLGRRTC